MSEFVGFIIDSIVDKIYKVLCSHAVRFFIITSWYYLHSPLFTTQYTVHQIAKAREILRQLRSWIGHLTLIHPVGHFPSLLPVHIQYYECDGVLVHGHLLCKLWHVPKLHSFVRLHRLALFGGLGGWCGWDDQVHIVSEIQTTAWNLHKVKLITVDLFHCVVDEVFVECS